MAEEDDARGNRIVNVQPSPLRTGRPALIPEAVQPDEYNPARSEEPLLRLWRRTLERYWFRMVVLLVPILGVVLALTYYSPIVSLIDVRLLVAAAMLTCAATALWSAYQLVEVRSDRVSDAHVFTRRMHSPVYTVPPLPRVRTLISDPDAQIDQWWNRFDPLRFAICGDRVDGEKGRCVLVSSAVREEGKTMLTSQLAARCGQTGTSTVLIDADLRGSAARAGDRYVLRCYLNQLLNVPAGPGLSEVLAGKADLHRALIPLSEGTFHFLQAGEPVSDSLRRFREPEFGRVIAQCRERFDLTIIDCGPVVDSPDPLAVCEWVDAVLFVAMYDYSCYPEIEWARRKLAATGVPIIAMALIAYPFDDPPA
jgi:Mrp family chromosome partitioning ATPase